jgi:hypothetical protein
VLKKKLDPNIFYRDRTVEDDAKLNRPNTKIFKNKLFPYLTYFWIFFLKTVVSMNRNEGRKGKMEVNIIDEQDAQVQRYFNMMNIINKIIL